jgi:hypothetical protein
MKGERRRGRGEGQRVGHYPRPTRLELPALGSHPVGGLPRPIPEAALYPVVARWLASTGFTCWRDVSYLGRWIDVFAEAADGRTAIVELKVTDWRKALEQARLVRPAASRTYIGVWAPYVHRAETDLARAMLSASGVGLLSINGECEIRSEGSVGAARYRRWVQKPARPTHRAA